MRYARCVGHEAGAGAVPQTTAPAGEKQGIIELHTTAYRCVPFTDRPQAAVRRMDLHQSPRRWMADWLCIVANLRQFDKTAADCAVNTWNPATHSSAWYRS